MGSVSIGLAIALTLVLAAEFVNGWTDAPNAIATVVSTNVMTPRQAIAMAVVLNTLGAMSGTAVAATVGNGIVVPSVLTLPAFTATMVAVIGWGILAARLGIPVSKSHALLAGLAGAGLASGGFAALQWRGWTKVGVGLGCSLLLGLVAAYLIAQVIIIVSSNAHPTRAKRSFDRLQLVSAGFMAFNHGLNDGQKFMGVFAMTLLAGGVISEFHISWWVIVICASTMGLGTSFGGWRIIRTVGAKMTRLTTWQGFAATLAASTTIYGASAYGVPLSTTHTITSAVVGAAASRRLADVKWSVLQKIMLAWLATFPACVALAYVAASVANHFWG